MSIRTVYPNILGNEIDLEVMIRDLKREGYGIEQIRDFMNRHVMDEGIPILSMEIEILIA